MKVALRIEEIVAVKTAQVKALGGATIKTVTILFSRWFAGRDHLRDGENHN
jgi:hypothetical protein